VRIAAEIEAKLLVPRSAQLDAIARLERLGAHPLRRRGIVRLHSIYLDTRELALARHGIALRLRRRGSQWELTGKWAGRTVGVLHERPELTVPLRGRRQRSSLPDGPLRCRLAAVVAGRQLRPILITDIERNVIEVLPKRGGARPVAELALDRVRITAPGRIRRGVRYCEAEIELVRGTRREVTILAALLRRRFGLLPSPASKFARGLAAFHGSRMLGGSEPQPPHRGDRLAAAGRKLLAQQLWRLRQHDAQIRCGLNGAALQPMWAAVEGMRTSLTLLGSAVPTGPPRKLHCELDWLGRLLERARSLDTLLQQVGLFARKLPQRQQATLRRRLQAARDARWKRLMAALGSARYFRLLVALERRSVKL
jgi:triphosphatase